MKEKFNHIKALLLICKARPELVSDIRIERGNRLHITTVCEKKGKLKGNVVCISKKIPSNNIEWVINLKDIPPLISITGEWPSGGGRDEMDPCSPGYIYYNSKLHK